ncbi:MULTISPECIES: CamS family sex pheromone protein [Amylolactobacillus]|uniref:Sex pheromone biosynthesis protein n=1 Tax=Amylolactobacillus amylophilus DSM 20533 = JCM 1125 TaxID=1423721 RepID=A0A1L6XD08_9LACO|nr:MULTISPECIES: CamS family sex pheromone protein [Amylolactobacillus]APT18863.1 sex pheromone biosynthesis protein [Amylolactobacillus amylophilus DSM 20533 = JCM 1125]GED80945.1 sex pheromone biosynthesis protein [Amylolactobacillus amylophilus]
MKRFLQIITALSVVIFLAGCGNLKNSDLSNNATTSTKKKSYQTTGSTAGEYSVLLRNGQYKISPISGITATNNSNDVDLKNLESGLMSLSLAEFSANKFVFQEGQELTRAQVSAWLNRYDKKSNKNGLNPVDNKKTDADTRNPIYLEQVIEQDYLTGSGSTYELGGISIGLAMNSVDYFTKVKDGPQYKTTINRATQLEQGKKIATKLLKQLRSRKKFQNIPIMIGIFSKTASDSLVGGNYLATGLAPDNKKSITDWKTVDEQSQVLPTIGNDKPINSNDAESFSNFKAAVQGYFPNISGVIGRVHYRSGQLTSFEITVNTQFYGYAQINSFAKLVLSSAKKFLPNNVPLEILVQSVNDPQALISKEKANSAYNVHVFR